MLEIEIIDSDIHRDEARQSLYEFYGKGANVKDDVHLLTHLLLQDLLDHEDGFSEKQAGLYLAKRSLLLPLLLELESGLESILFSEGRIPDLTSLFLVLGAYATLEALPLLLRGLEWCTGPALNEAVLALVKTGRQYPREVTAAIRNQLERESLREGLINAVDVLGILGPLEGNYDHLLKHVRGLNLRDPVHLEMAVFTADALFRSGEPELAHEGTCLAEEISLLPESVEAYRVSSILDAIMKGRADSVPAGPRGPWQVGTSPEADAYPLLSTPNPIPILFPRSSFINDRIFVPPKGHKK